MTEDTIKSHHYPTPKQLQNILKPDTSGLAVRWYDLGTELLTDDTVGTLDVIKADHPNDASVCCNKMFVKWLELQPNATWSQLIIALINIGMKTTADSVISCLIKDEKSAQCNISSKIVLQPDMILTPKQASSEFGILLINIIKELAKNEAENLESIKVMCSCFMIKDDLFFDEEQQEAINACSNIRTLLTTKLRHCWRWYDLSFLKKIVQSSDSANHCKQLLDTYEKKIYIQMKLQDIHEHCQQKKQNLPEGHHKMVAIVKNKIFSQITLEEYKELKDFISKNCEVDPYVISPFTKASVSSLLLEWWIPLTAVPHMIEMATINANVFITQNFVYLKISSTVIFDERNNERRCIQLCKSSKFGYVGAVKTLLNNKYIDVNSRDEDKLTPLHRAAANGHSSVVEVLIRSHADINAVDTNKVTPLHLASVNGDSSVVELLIRSHADVNAVDNNKATPLHLAAVKGHSSVVELLIRSHADVNAFDNDNATPLHLAAVKGHSSVAELLIRSHADVNAVEEHKLTPLHCAATNGHSSVVEILIRSHADINAVDEDKWTPLHLAAEKGHSSVVEVLNRLHADINAITKDKVTPLHLAAANGHSSVVEVLIRSHADINAITIGGLSPVHLAAKRNHASVVEKLVNYGALVNSIEYMDKRTSLHLAAKEGHKSVVEILIRCRADIRAVDKNGLTALHLAATNNHASVVEKLVNFRAPVNAVEEVCIHVANNSMIQWYSKHRRLL